MTDTNLQALLSLKLEADVVKFIDQHVKAGLSLREVAEVIEEETGITISKSSVYLWLMSQGRSKVKPTKKKGNK
jgi:transposase